uniref:Uncharacterized protein n=1 Tax=Utricularia reniformis TaxID=192314 RepID=A0A1Y0B035_9LAMI|nr:hypothetical protein AEK19_MT0529 [Utricularia reniformis]ART30785.1 hypothetical protein AEK19_MT0529 [Utricularia reniformis]
MCKEIIFTDWLLLSVCGEMAASSSFEVISVGKEENRDLPVPVLGVLVSICPIRYNFSI